MHSMNKEETQSMLVILALFAACARMVAAPAAGPLITCKDNPRYFADRAGKAIYLTGSHTWANLQDMGFSNPPPAFDYPAYLNDKTNPPPSDGSKVIILDTDHLWGVGGDVSWVWKSFLRGHNPIWMDPLDKVSVWEPTPSNAEAVRSNLGYARRFAERTKLAALKPCGALASSGYCLADPGREYLIYLPDGGKVTVDLSVATGDLAVEWFDPVTGSSTQVDNVKGGASRTITAPFKGHAVLHLVAKIP
jgi:hypothetical protein